ncbi:hypothetical protein [Methylobacterium brachythecii]|uniref:Uncharacterized protein n=1 Tax=Methylobacterium brachythecii TaxID=1176177 RepID=A0A7W6F946_9HYPH|nr:hypothetical protein [Methylobacterium brachythecii]MBB3905105.1 hypothetical protein [Methylobacterium brachythecii]GLS44386.1 hypothetical protein GCM10007884_23740 [Methylobacterium brachythecii]
MTAPAARTASGLLDISAARAKDARRSRAADPRGDRYNRSGAYKHGAGVGKPVRRQAVQTSVCAVSDPFDPARRLQVSVNRNVDILEVERSHGRIQVSEYETGRQVQAILERASGARLGSSGWDISGSRDQTIAHELAVIYAIEDARLVAKLKDKIVRAVGTPGARFLAEVLVGGKTFAQYAAARGRSGERGTAGVANHFRILMEYLDEAFAAEGVKDVTREWFFRAEPSSEPTDEKGRVVPKGHGHVWGGEESRYARHMNDEARQLVGRTARVRDIVGARHRVTGDN